MYKICLEVTDEFWKRAKSAADWGKEQKKEQPAGTKLTTEEEKEISVKGTIEYKLITSWQEIYGKNCCGQKKVTPPEGSKEFTVKRGTVEFPGYAGPEQKQETKK